MMVHFGDLGKNNSSDGKRLNGRRQAKPITLSKCLKRQADEQKKMVLCVGRTIDRMKTAKAEDESTRMTGECERGVEREGE
jgi:hypothetical protein